jgi:hypothetical protein
MEIIVVYFTCCIVCLRVFSLFRLDKFRYFRSFKGGSKQTHLSPQTALGQNQRPMMAPRFCMLVDETKTKYVFHVQI